MFNLSFLNKRARFIIFLLLGFLLIVLSVMFASFNSQEKYDFKNLEKLFYKEDIAFSNYNLKRGKFGEGRVFWRDGIDTPDYSKSVYLNIFQGDSISSVKSKFNNLILTLDWDKEKVYEYDFDYILSDDDSDEDLLFCNEVPVKGVGDCHSWSYYARYDNLIISINFASREKISQSDIKTVVELLQSHFEQKLEELE